MLGGVDTLQQQHLLFSEKKVVVNGVLGGVDALQQQHLLFSEKKIVVNGVLGGVDALQQQHLLFSEKKVVVNGVLEGVGALHLISQFSSKTAVTEIKNTKYYERCVFMEITTKTIEAVILYIEGKLDQYDKALKIMKKCGAVKVNNIYIKPDVNKLFNAFVSEYGKKTINFTNRHSNFMALLDYAEMEYLPNYESKLSDLAYQYL